MPAICRFKFFLCLLVLPLVIRPVKGFAVVTALAIGGIAFSVYNLGSHAKMHYTRHRDLRRFKTELLKLTRSIDEELDMNNLDAAAKLEVEAQLAILVQIYTHCSGEENEADLLPAVIDKFKQVLTKYDKFSDVNVGLEKMSLEEVLTGLESQAKSMWDKTTIIMAVRTLGLFVHRTAHSLGRSLKHARGDLAVVLAILKIVQTFQERGAEISPHSNLTDTVERKASAKAVGKQGSVGNEHDDTEHVVGKVISSHTLPLLETSQDDYAWQ